MSTDTTTADTTADDTTHREALEVIDHQIRFLTGQLPRHEGADYYDRIHQRLGALRKSRAVLDGTAVPDYIAALGNRMADTERQRSTPVPRHTLEERHILCGTPVTLNGNPARITGVFNDFATVTDTKSGLSAEWSWGTVARVAAAGGKFHS